MANGRLYLRNKLSNELVFMGKAFGDEYYLCDYNDDWMDKLNYFYERAYLNNGIGGYWDDGAEWFEIINEQDITDKDWDAKLQFDEDWERYKKRLKEEEDNER